MIFRTIVFLLLAAMVCVESACAQNQLGQLIEWLSPEQTDDLRIVAADALMEMNGDELLAAQVKLTQGLGDSNARIRQKFASTLGLILSRNHRECPLVLVDLLFDSDEVVRDNVLFVVGLFEKFEVGCFPKILEFYRDADATIRRDNFRMLAAAGGNDQRVLEILRTAIKGDDAGARVNATAAMWTATQDLRVYLPHLIDRVNEATDFAKSSAQQKMDKNDHSGVYLNLGLLGASHQLHIHLAERRQPFLEALQALAQSESVKRRQGLACWISMSIPSSASNASANSGDDWQLPEVELSSLRPILNSMADDEDETVRKHIESAIERLDKIVNDQ